jgi:hypothetical protein
MSAKDIYLSLGLAGIGAVVLMLPARFSYGLAILLLSLAALIYGAIHDDVKQRHPQTFASLISGLLVAGVLILAFANIPFLRAGLTKTVEPPSQNFNIQNNPTGGIEAGGGGGGIGAPGGNGGVYNGLGNSSPNSATGAQGRMFQDPKTGRLLVCGGGGGGGGAGRAKGLGGQGGGAGAGGLCMDWNTGEFIDLKTGAVVYRPQIPAPAHSRKTQ